MLKRKINVVTLCSGYDAQMMGLRRLEQFHDDIEFDLIAWAEIEKNAIMLHNAVFPEYKDRNMGDITTCDWSAIKEPIDLLTYSTPCQSISVAGTQEGLKKDSGTASSLIWAVERAIQTLRPKMLLLENVKALCSKKFMPDFLEWQALVESYGYANFWQVLDTKDYGVPQHRERVYMISLLKTEEMPEPKYAFPKPFPLKTRLKHFLLPYGAVSESYYLSDEKVKKILEHCDRKVAEGCGFRPNFQTRDGIAGTIAAKYGCRQTDTYTKERVEGEAKIMQVGNLADDTRRTFKNPERSRVYSAEGLAPSLKATGADRVIVEPIMLKSQRTDRIMQIGNTTKSPSRANPQRGRVYDPEGIAPTLATYQGGNLEPQIIEPCAVAMRGRGKPVEQHLEFGDNIANCVTTVEKDSMVAIPEPHALSYSRSSRPENGQYITRRHFSDVMNALCASRRETNEALIAEPCIQMVGNIYPSKGQGGYVVNPNGVAPTVCECHGEVTRILESITQDAPAENDNQTVWYYRIRKLHPIEAYRLQGISDCDIQKMMNYTETVALKSGKTKEVPVSKSAHYQAAGNSITVDVLFHIFENLFYPPEEN